MSAPKHTPGPWMVFMTCHHGCTTHWLATHTHTAVSVNPNSYGFEGDYPHRDQDGYCIPHEDLGIDPRRIADATLIAASPELLRELQAAHQIIRNALAVMTVEQKEEWGRLNERDGVDGEGVTRANEREAVIAKAGGAT